MSHRQDVEQFIRCVEIDTSAARDRQVLGDILQAHQDFRQQQPQRRPSQVRHRKWAVAAVLGLAVVLSIVMSETFREPAWAIEQTIAALDGFRAIYGSGIFSLDGKTAVQAECWARPNRDGTRSGDMRIQTASGYLVIVNEAQGTTHTYDPAQNLAMMEDGVGLYCRPWVNGDYFRDVKNSCEEWREQYRTDPTTGRGCVIVKARNLHDGQSYEYHFDLQSKLPLRAKVWQNPDFAGVPYFDVQQIVYNPALPEGIFDFQAPAGATIVDKRHR